ncbi:MAG TPA: rhomboid family intramembrane serine protease [Bacteroidales bacterium]|nr:rhomboid family intramembrane serine protease [Bacteroidales bacterium]HQI46323.1 rhomboid family intramembrane serine protease [Bacteroidales bacterium]
MKITWIIILLTSAISIPAFSNRAFFDKMKFNAFIIKENKQWYRFISYGLIHADWMHLLINMFVLYSFGEQVEMMFIYIFGLKGTILFLILYVSAIFISAYPSYEKHKNNSWYNAVGASGAVSAILFSSILLLPSSKIYLLFIPFPIPAVIFGILYLIYSAYMAKKAVDNIGHDAHFWGAIYGLTFPIVLKPSLFLNFINQIENIF